ncbi:hypothetical protein KVT40_006400 [Elsinoe batatas]|uniref:Major facilitator superfamily (MFS) profile domain-containing protein n=1 Tax=Elsinoe batatas TaxID=2601811 RepID=A0A8K0KXV6_9PEZI|nr:hypothetical protein KVT40_006400 [Elsinoe batatas]
MKRDCPLFRAEPPLPPPPSLLHASLHDHVANAVFATARPTAAIQNVASATPDTSDGASVIDSSNCPKYVLPRRIIERVGLTACAISYSESALDYDTQEHTLAVFSTSIFLSQDPLLFDLRLKSPIPLASFNWSLHSTFAAMEKDTTRIGRSSDAGSPSPSKQEFGGVPGANKDQAFQFLTTHHATEEEVAAVNLKRLRRVIDWHIIPIMLLVYIIQFLDKVLLNYAAVMGISTDLKLKGNNFADVNTYTFLSILLAEFPTGFILNKVPAGKWLGINTILWGVSTAVVAATKNYTGLLISRIFLGIFEAAVGPCLIIISSQWYTKNEQPARFGLWYTGVGAGQVCGSLLSYGFQHVTGASLASWRIMFIVLGAITITIGVGAYFMIPDSPMTAKWMNDAEKSALLQHISVNMTGVVNKQFKASQLVDLLTDPQMYLLTLMLLLLSVTSGVGTTFSATLLRNVGYNAKQSAVLNAPSGVVSIVAVLLGSFGVRYAKHRWAFIIAAAIPAALSGALMSFVNTKGGVLAGIWQKA